MGVGNITCFAFVRSAAQFIEGGNVILLASPILLFYGITTMGLTMLIHAPILRLQCIYLGQPVSLLLLALILFINNYSCLRF
jgi:hypothetical protein